MKFTKMHGLGNDYIYIKCFEEQVNEPGHLAVKMSDRHFGIGGDGIVLILPSAAADARMRMFNADGSEAEMCGNAIRCVGKYLYDHEIVNHDRITVETLAGIKELTLTVVDKKVQSVKVDMGEPVLSSELIPVTGNNRKVVMEPIRVKRASGDYEHHFTAVSMGNPHCVIFVPEITDRMVLEDGPQLEVHPYFPRKINVEFVKVLSRNLIQMRVWERGSGETMACGTGACASVAAGIVNQLLDSRVTVKLLGGDLEIEWAGPGNHLFKTGPAVEVFTGDWSW